MIQPLGLVTNHDYDPNGNEIKLTDPKGQVIDFEYDELNRLKTKVYNLTSADLALYTRTHKIEYVYDANDNLTRIDETKSSGTDPPAIVSSFKTYDDLDRLETETDAWGRRLTYDYDPQGNRTLLIDPDSVRTEYAYDELNRLDTLTFGDGQAVTYEYFPDGLKKTVTNPNGTTSTYLYDAADRMTDITHTGPTGVVSSYQYVYDASSNRERQIETNGGRTETTDYAYDFVNRLKSVTYPDRTTQYEYDLSGNRIQEVTTGAAASDKTFEYDAINRLERMTDTTTSAVVAAYGYDENGNTTSKTAGGVTTSFLFDIRDQLGEVRQGASILGRYGYDYDGRRILKIGDDGRRQYTYDQLSVVTEADQANATVSKYDYGMDQLVRLNNRNEGRSFFHLDFLGSTVGLTDAAGGSRQSIFYDAWGNERERIGSSANNFTFTGHELDEETGLIYAKARFYDANIGRFLSQDDVLGEVSDPPDLHLYAYAQMNPLIFIDPSGNIEFIQDLREGVRDVSNLVMESGISLAENETIQKVPLLPRAISSTGGAISGGVNFVNSIFGLVNFGGNLAVGALSFLSPESSIVQQSAKEITETFDQLSNTARVVKETGGMNTAMGIAKSGGDKFFQALKGDPRANAEINALGAEIAAGILTGGGLAAASKGTATQVTKNLVEETLESAGKQAARNVDDIGEGVLHQTASRFSSGGPRARVVARLEESAAARAASNFPKTASINKQLLDVTARASRITDRIIAQGSTYWARVHSNPALGGVRIANIAAKKPNLVRSIIRGNIMDDVAKRLASKAEIPFLRVTPRGARGPDFLIRFLDKAWDVTTPKSWPRHVKRYADEPYDLMPLLY
jgi:RHS repeat-associated protein